MLEALEASRSGEGPPGPPPDRTAVAICRRVDDLEREIRKRLEQHREVRTDPVRRDQVPLTDHPIDRARRPAVDGAVNVTGAERLQVLLGDLQLEAIGAQSTAAAYVALTTDIVATMPRDREVGRGERILPGLWRLRLPLPLEGVPHCNAWAVARKGGIMLVDTGMHHPGSMAIWSELWTTSAWRSRRSI